MSALANPPAPADPDDIAAMRAALALAARGLGECWPNPSVGCVIVRRNHVVARGRTASGGRPHAETQALATAGPAARGATAYVTLEPCNHTGHTPPCTQALIQAGIARVVVACTDPDARVNGQGIVRLREAGIVVQTGVLHTQAVHLNEGFFRRIRDRRPLVTLKLASTLDGRIATATGASQWITGPHARRAAHALRAEHDAILAGIGTVRADNPSLTCRLPGARTRKLVRIIADTQLRTPPAAALLATACTEPTWLLTTLNPTHPRAQPAAAAGAEIIQIAPGPAGLDLQDALAQLAARGLTRLLVEGGATLAAGLLAADLVDRIAWFHAPALIGGDGLPAVQALGVQTLAAMPRFQRMHATPLGPDMLTLFERAAT